MKRKRTKFLKAKTTKWTSLKKINLNQNRKFRTEKSEILKKNLKKLEASYKIKLVIRENKSRHQIKFKKNTFIVLQIIGKFYQ